MRCTEFTPFDHGSSHCQRCTSPKPVLTALFAQKSEPAVSLEQALQDALDLTSKSLTPVLHAYSKLTSAPKPKVQADTLDMDPTTDERLAEIVTRDEEAADGEAAKQDDDERLVLRV